MTEPWLLCVDDEPRVLKGLDLQLSFDYTVRTAAGGAEGLALLEAHPDCAVIISDMRMPLMNGAQFLAQARELTPDSTRMLLTGYSEMNDAIDAINKGGIFRFLTKPTKPDDLKAAVAAAMRQWELIRSEKVLLEQTLHGAVGALIEALEIASPEIFSRARRIEAAVRHVATELGLTPVWEVALAGLMLRLGWIAIPNETTARFLAGAPSSRSDQAMIDETYATSARLVGRIARLEGVAAIISEACAPSGLVDGPTVVRAAAEFDDLCRRNTRPAMALAEMEGSYPAPVLEALSTWDGAGQAFELVELGVRDLRSGMVIEKDVIDRRDKLLVQAGVELTDTTIQRLINFARSQGVQEPITVSVLRTETEPAASLS